ncbi:MAG: 2-dehydropantoate 2-reductase [Deltaproteobacteria bacterium]|nr:2-dehydropantoate 2-reductase [Deltaproteobacteria bacterium]
MNFLIVGPGAMGCLFAASLKKAGYPVTLLDNIEERAQKINAQGIFVEGIKGKFNVKVPAVTGGPAFIPDAVLICVKSNDTRDAGLAAKPWTGPGTLILTLQNGIGNMETLKEIFGNRKVLGGVTSEGATLLDWGRIRHAGRGETIIGPGGISDNILEKIVTAYNRAGFQTRLEDDVESLLWGKLIINVGINALAAITRLKNGCLPDIQGTRLIMERAVSEAVEIAEKKGIELPYPDPMERVINVCRSTSGNIASMLQDVLNNKITEIDFINGAIVREGNAVGTNAYTNMFLTSLVQSIQESYEKRV